MFGYAAEDIGCFSERENAVASKHYLNPFDLL